MEERIPDILKEAMSVHGAPEERPAGISLNNTTTATALVDAEDYEYLNQWRWYVNPEGYAFRAERRDGKTRSFSMHREIMGLKRGDKRVVDHINGTRHDNRRANLRIVSVSENHVNRHTRSGRTSKCFGVSKTPEGKWQAGVRTREGRSIHVCLVEDEAFAARLRDGAAFRIWGEHTSLNFPEEIANSLDLLRDFESDAAKRARYAIAYAKPGALELVEAASLIRAREEVNFSYKKLGKAFGVSAQTARRICLGRR